MNGELVGGIPTALKNMSSSVRIMKFPIYGKIKNVPNHQPDENNIKKTPVPSRIGQQLWDIFCTFDASENGISFPVKTMRPFHALRCFWEFCWGSQQWTTCVCGSEMEVVRAMPRHGLTTPCGSKNWQKETLIYGFSFGRLKHVTWHKAMWLKQRPHTRLPQVAFFLFSSRYSVP